MPAGLLSPSDRTELDLCRDKLASVGQVSAQVAQQMRCLGEVLRPCDLRQALAEITAAAAPYTQAMRQIDQTGARIGAALRAITDYAPAR